MSAVAAGRGLQPASGVGPGEALRLGLRDFYANSWRLLPVNAALGAALVLSAIAGIAVRAALVLVVLAGPLAAALVHCAVTLTQTGSVRLADAFEGLRLHWRRGLALGSAGAAFAGLAVLAAVFYSGSVLALPLAFLVAYLVVLAGVYQLLLWPLAIAEPSRPLRRCAREAAGLAASRPGATLALGLALAAVNLAAIALAVMPFLTLSIAYSFVVASHFALPRATSEDAS